MAELRSWLGAIVTFIVFVVAKRFTVGLALPLLVAITAGCVYIWIVVLRVAKVPRVEAVPAQQPSPAPKVDATAKSSGEAPTVKATRGTDAPATTSRDLKMSTGAETLMAQLEPKNSKAVITKRTVEPVPEEILSQINTSDASTEAYIADIEKRTAEASPVQSIGEAHEEEQKAVSADEEAAEGCNRPDPSSPQVDPCTADSSAASPAEDENEAAASTEAADEPRPNVDAEGSASEGDTAAVGASGDRSDKCLDSDSDSDGEKREADEDADPEKAAELKLEGNEAFKAGRVYDAREAYSEALFLTPSSDKTSKAVLHSNRAAVHQKLSCWDDCIADCKSAIELDPGYTKAYCRRSAAFEAQNKYHDALEDLKKAIELDPSLRSKEFNRQQMLQTRSQEQFEKDKDEMMDKLKGLGNTILGKFGMSTDNFAMEQDPNTGSYSMKFNQ